MYQNDIGKKTLKTYDTYVIYQSTLTNLIILNINLVYFLKLECTEIVGFIMNFV